MNIDFTCQKCDSSFELDLQDLSDGTEKLQCPNCDAKAPTSTVDDFVSALTELKTQVAALSKKFAVNLAVETEDLESEEEADEEVEEDEDESDEDDDLDFDEDGDDEDFEDEEYEDNDR